MSPAFSHKLLVALALALICVQAVLAITPATDPTKVKFEPEACQACLGATTCMKKRYEVKGDHFTGHITPNPSCGALQNCNGHGKPCDCKACEQYCYLQAGAKDQVDCLETNCPSCSCDWCISACDQNGIDTNEKTQCYNDYCPMGCTKCKSCDQKCGKNGSVDNKCYVDNCPLCAKPSPIDDKPQH